jgi:uncharacterized delta-60 repeat protein
LERHHADGTPDATFGQGGFVPLRFHGQPLREGWTALAVQADGKIVVGDGSSLLRFRPDGAPDATFGEGGGVATQDGRVTGIAVQQDGALLTVSGYYDPAQDQSYLRVARFLANGQPDPDFGDHGKAMVPLQGDLGYPQIAVGADGTIVAAGTTFNAATGKDWLVVRLTADGHLDPTFGQGGQVVTDLFGYDDGIHGLLIQTDGKVIVTGGGALGRGEGGRFGSPPPSVGVMARYTADGRLDPTFGTAGIVRSDQTPLAGSELVQTADGQIFALGNVSAPDDPFHVTLALARLRADGTIDPTFGDDGRRVLPGATDVQDLGLYRLADGKLLVITGVGGNPPSLALYRVLTV